MDGHDATRSRFRRGGKLLAGLFYCAVPHVVCAEGWDLGGHLKYQYSITDYAADNVAAIYGESPAHDQAVDGRLKADWREGGFDLSVHYELLALSGDSVATRRALVAAGLLVAGTTTGLPDDRRRLFDLTDELANGDRTVAVQRLDRLAAGYGNGTWLVRFGRQAVSWGNGLVFQPLDFVNPFSPVTVDKDYKTGDDMLYGQWQTGGQRDVQVMIVPRRDPLSHAVLGTESSYAAKLRLRAGALDIEALAARHYDENLFGLGLARSLAGAVWRLDLACANLAGQDSAWSAVTNFDYSWALFGLNMYGFIEYYRNGVGEAGTAGYVAPNPALSARIARGELFTLARDYAAAGVQAEVTPLVSLFANLIQNLDDGSRVTQVRAVYSWRENIQWMAGFNLPAGERGSEFGGIPIPLFPGQYTGSGRATYLRVARYF